MNWNTSTLRQNHLEGLGLGPGLPSMNDATKVAFDGSYLRSHLFMDLHAYHGNFLDTYHENLDCHPSTYPDEIYSLS